MKQFLLIPLLYFVCASVSLAQQHSITGAVKDSTGAGLEGASVVLLQARDSVFLEFSLTDAKGAFEIKRVSKGAYILQVNYLGYHNHWQALNVEEQDKILALGDIKMMASSTLLSAVEVKADRTPLAIRKDTIEYNAGAFKTAPGAVVEDLLKKLPGVQVQADGTIKAQGETVRKVLVDGKEFFGDDPKIATKNLPADAVNKVQVFDKKSERAEFTGIDDGADEKTINLKLKDDKKQGYFGNVSAGAGNKDRFEGKFNLNSFGRKSQISALGMSNNTNQQGFSFEDYMGFMGGLSNFMSAGSGGGRISINLGDGEVPLGIAGGTQNGFMRTMSGGLNLNHTFSKRSSLSANYFYNQLRHESGHSIYRENFLDEGSFNSSETSDRLTQNGNHRLNLTYKHRIDSFQDFSVRSRLIFNDADYGSSGLLRTNDTAGLLRNGSNQEYDSDGRQWRGEGSLTYRRRFLRKGRSIVATMRLNGNDNLSNGFTTSDNFFVQFDSIIRQNIQQRQQYTDEGMGLNGSLSYTEPLGKKRFLEWRFEHQQYDNQSAKNFYDQYGAPTPGEVFNPVLSNNYRRDYRYERGSMSFVLNRKKYNFTLGSALQQARLNGVVNGSDQSIDRTFTQLLPYFRYNRDARTGRHFNVDYYTSLREPSLEQLQPVVDNRNPLSIYAGNPDLRPEYQHELNARFMDFDAFVMRSLMFNLSATYTQNRITNAMFIDSLFRRNTRPINVKSDWLFRGYANLSTPVRPLKINIQVSVNSSFNRGILFVNEVENQTSRWNNDLEFSVDNRLNKKLIDASMGISFNHNSSAYSVSRQLNQTFVSTTYFGDIKLFPGSKWALNTRLDYRYYPEVRFGKALHIPLLQAGITRYVLHNNKGQLKISAFDLLDKNQGISRENQYNFFEEERIVNLTRYFMLSFTYSLTGFVKKG